MWTELANRLSKQALSKQETEDAIQELIAYMKKTRPAGWDQPLSWQKDFVRAAVQAKMISGKVFLDLCDAFYGPKPVAQPLPPIRQGKSSFQLIIRYGNPWSHESGLGVGLLWDVQQVQMDGRPLSFRQTNVLGDQWLGLCDGNFEVGDHEITVEIECCLRGSEFAASKYACFAMASGSETLDNHDFYTGEGRTIGIAMIRSGTEVSQRPLANA